MDLCLAGKVAIVTGANSGIGREISRALAREGMHVCVNWIEDQEATESLVEELGANSGKSVSHRGNVADREVVCELIKRAETELGPVDAMIHNAGVTSRQTIVDTSPDDWQRVTSTNLDAAFHCFSLAGRRMIDQRTKGSLIAITSMHGSVAKSHMGAYCSTKAALNMMIKQLAVELAEFGIRANAVAPGTIDTGMNPVYHPDTGEHRIMKAQLLKRIPMGEIGTPNAIGAAVAFLISEMSSYTTGAVLAVDGGYSADGTPR